MVPVSDKDNWRATARDGRRMKWFTRAIARCRVINTCPNLAGCPPHRYGDVEIIASNTCATQRSRINVAHARRNAAAKFLGHAGRRHPAIGRVVCEIVRLGVHLEWHDRGPAGPPFEPRIQRRSPDRVRTHSIGLEPVDVHFPRPCLVRKKMRDSVDRKRHEMRPGVGAVGPDDGWIYETSPGKLE